jgi:hypothetical protein
VVIFLLPLAVLQGFLFVFDILQTHYCMYGLFLLILLRTQHSFHGGLVTHNSEKSLSIIFKNIASPS